jgi:prepilin-type processing-associated H-X9-DG protein
MFDCPSDNVEAGNETNGVSIFLTLNSGGANLEYFGGGTIPLGRTNYVGNAGALGNCGGFYGQYVGPYYEDSALRITDIQDGTSNTIAIGETLGGTDQGPRDFTMCWMSAGGQPAAWDLTEPTSWVTFGSRHSGVVQFAFCDGSVRPISKIGNNTNWFSNQWYAFEQAAGYQDGSVIDWTQLQ